MTDGKSAISPRLRCRVVQKDQKPQRQPEDEPQRIADFNAKAETMEQFLESASHLLLGFWVDAALLYK
jgi:hypothetical protein